MYELLYECIARLIVGEPVRIVLVSTARHEHLQRGEVPVVAPATVAGVSAAIDLVVDGIRDLLNQQNLPEEPQNVAEPVPPEVQPRNRWSCRDCIVNCCLSFVVATIISSRHLLPL